MVEGLMVEVFAVIYHSLSRPVWCSNLSTGCSDGSCTRSAYIQLTAQNTWFNAFDILKGQRVPFLYVIFEVKQGMFYIQTLRL